MAVFVGVKVIMVKMGKLVVFTILAFVVLPYTDALGLDTANMEQVQKNIAAASGRVTSNDQAIMGDFVAEGLQEILFVESNIEIAEIRAQLASFAGSAQPSEYSLAYIRIMETEIPKVLTEVARLETSDKKTAAELNLMVLIAQLKSSDLATYALPFISHKNAGVKYWAVKAIANKSIAEQLDSTITGDEDLKAKITSSLMPIMTEDVPAVILDTIVDFAANLKGSHGRDLIKKICILRLNAYADWTVKYELMDAGLLNTMANQIAALEDDQRERADLARMFAQLYSYVMQRFILSDEMLDEPVKQNLIGVMLDVEEKGLSKLLGSRQIDIKKAVNAMRRDPDALQRKHDAIFGSTKRPGQITYELKFNYGTSPEGAPLTYPKELKVLIAPDGQAETME